MKRFLCMMTACLLLVGMLCALPVSAAAGMSVSASASTVTVGQKVTVTLKYNGGGKLIGGLIGKIAYDAKIFTYESASGNGVEVNGGAGVVKYVYYASGSAPKSITVSLTFKAKDPGSCDFSVSTEEFFNDEDYSSLGSPSGKVTVEANNPTLSANADLKSLTPSKGTLTPKFNPDVTDYTIEVGYAVESLSLSATADHDDAKTSISGKNALEVGKNTRVITVTAPNGKTKKYTVVITRGQKPTTTTTTYVSTTTVTTTTATTTTTVPIPEDALDVEVQNKPYVIADTQVSDDLPEGFTWGTVTINRVEVPAAISPQGITLLYLLSKEDEEDHGFYLYDDEEGTFTPYRSLKAAGGVWVLYDLPTEVKPMAVVTEGTLEWEDGTVSAYVYEDEDLSDFYVVWAAPLDGETGWYTYDADQGTFQRYHAAPTETTTTTKVTKTTTTKKENPIKEVLSLDSARSFFSDYRNLILVGLILLGGIILGVIIRLISLSVSGGRKHKHRRGKH